MQVSTVGVDLAKNVFQIHGVDSLGKVVITRQLRRNQVIEGFSYSRAATTASIAAYSMSP